MKLTIRELQRAARAGDEWALLDLGRAVLNIDFCLYGEPNRYCIHEHELGELNHQLENEIPPDCPHCGKAL